MRLLLSRAVPRLALMAVWAALGAGCARADAPAAADAGGHASESPRNARDMVANGAVLLDVRTRGEFASGHIDGAQNIPVEELADRLDELDASRAIVVYCHSGRRSRMATDLLRRRGFGDVLDMGPQSAW